MKRLDLLPNEENLLETLFRDSIDRNKDIVNFYNLLQSLEYVNSIAIDGRWGSGKTFFVKQAKMVVNALNPLSSMADDVRNKVKSSLHLHEKDEEPTNADKAVYYDAWANDSDDEPILSLVYEITRQLSVDFALADKKVAKTVGAIFELFSSRNANGVIEALSSDDPYTKLADKKEIEEKIKVFLAGLLPERGNRLIIFIDELDR